MRCPTEGVSDVTVRSMVAVVLAVVAIFGLTSTPAIAGGSVAPSVASAAGTDELVRAHLFRYYAEPARQTVVGERVTAECRDYPENFWGVETEWYIVIHGWVECPGPQ